MTKERPQRGKVLGKKKMQVPGILYFVSAQQMVLQVGLRFLVRSLTFVISPPTFLVAVLV